MPDSGENAIKMFFSSWRELQTKVSPYREAARIVEKKHAKNGANFNIFSVLSPNEVRLSTFFKHLLDPNASHGQEANYLEIFLNMLGVDYFTREEMIHARVVVEDITLEDRRIDILLEIKSIRPGRRLVIGIENKPTASESKNQISHYQQDLVRRFKGAQHILLFLSGRGECSLTSTKSTEVAQAASLIEWAYTSCGDKPTVTSWIQECRKITTAQSVWSILLAFESYLEENFCSKGEETIMNKRNISVDHEALFQYSIQPENIALTLEIQGNDIIKLTKLHVLKCFFAKINSNLRELLSKNPEWISSFETTEPLNGSGVSIRLANWRIGFALKLEIWDDIWVIGLRAPLNIITDGKVGDGTINLVQQSVLIKKENSLSRKYKPSNHWPRYRNVDELKGTSNGTLKKLANDEICNELARRLADEFIELAETFRDAPELTEAIHLKSETVSNEHP